MKLFRLIAGLLLSFSTCCLSAPTEPVNWNQFRGPNGSGILAGCKPPFKIVAGRASWKTTLPTGKSSPVLWRDRIFLTGVEADRLATLCLDAKSGKVLWKQFAPKVSLQRIHRANSFAASTPCVDKESVYVYFGAYGLLCYDHKGIEQWKKPIPTPKSMYGVAASPILHGQYLILVLDDDANLPDSKLSCSKVIALDITTGEFVWQTPRPYNRGAWSTPMIWQHDNGTDLVVPGNDRAYGYDPATGKEKWYVTGFSREPIAVPVAGNGRLYVSVAMQGGRGDQQLDPEPFWNAMLNFDSNGDAQIGRDEITTDFTMPFRPELPPAHPGFGLPLAKDPAKRKQQQNGIFDWRDKNKDGFWTKEEFTADMTVGRGKPNLAAIEPGGKGNITESHVRWNLRKGIPEIPSPIFHAGRIYLLRSGGNLTCVNADTGDVVYRQRLGASGQYVASPVIANDHLYLFSNRGVITVVKCGDDFKMTHQADLDMAIDATPAMDQNTLYLRSGNAIMAFR